MKRQVFFDKLCLLHDEHKMEVVMKLHASGEDYLKTIYILMKENSTVRSLNVAERMGVSKPSISHAVKLLREGGFLIMNDDYTLHLTDLG